ncbi:MAG: DUF1418 family protein [Gammaproteobacteria bacterium]|nr:DUF1418 family protein [Gammaproteobacteria bacterium]MDH5511665.1 DUF1418 family protein [Gammaproteobacteria bacterium]
MPKKHSMTLPPMLLILDVIGGVLLGLGLAKLFADVDILPASWRFENYEYVMIGVGAALILPLIVHVVKQAGSATKAGHP